MSEHNINRELIQRKLNSNWNTSIIKPNESYLQNLIHQIAYKLIMFDIQRTFQMGKSVEPNKTMIKVKLKHVIKALIQLLNIKKKSNGSLLYTHLDYPFFVTDDPQMIKRIIQALNEYRNVEIKFPYRSNINRCVRLIITSLMHDDSIENVNQLPDHFILTNDYDLLNGNTRQFENIEDYLHFDFIYENR